MVRTIVKREKKRLRLANSNHRNPLKPRYFGLFQPWSFDRSAIVSTWHEDTELLSHSSCPSVRSGSGTDRRTCPFVRSPPGTYPRFFRPCDRLQELIDGFVGTCQGHYSKTPANVYQPGRKLIMCLSITHTWLRAEASLPARLSLDIQFLIEKSVVTVLLVL